MIREFPLFAFAKQAHESRRVLESLAMWALRSPETYRAFTTEAGVYCEEWLPNGRLLWAFNDCLIPPPE